MTRLALETELTSIQREYLEMAHRSAESLLDIINDILDFSKIEAGKLALYIVPFNVRDCTENVLKDLAIRAHAKNLELTCAMDVDVPETVQGDPGRLRQILINLVGNAIKFTEQGEVSMSVHVDAHSTDEVCLRFVVRDTGMGIPRDKLQQICEAFEQSDTSITRSHCGTGLGLTISRKLAVMMRGKIDVDSEFGVGSTFILFARFGVTSEPTPPQPQWTIPEFSRLSVLIVDDNATNRRLLYDTLLHWHMRPHCEKFGCSHARQSAGRLQNATESRGLATVAPRHLSRDKVLETGLGRARLGMYYPAFSLRLKMRGVVAMQRWIWILLVVLLGCRAAPITGRRQLLVLPEQQEVTLGSTAFQEVVTKEPPSTNQHHIELVSRVGQRIAAVAERPDFQWEFHVIASPTQNAFCLPGGKVAVYEGILPICQNEAGLAVVMSHEIGHALARHGGERISQGYAVEAGKQLVSYFTRTTAQQQRDMILKGYGVGSQYGVILPYSRKHESEADHIGVILMAKAGYNPEEAPRFWNRFGGSHTGSQPIEFMSTHPSDQRRSQDLALLLPEAMQYYGNAPNKYGLGEMLDASQPATTAPLAGRPASSQLLPISAPPKSPTFGNMPR